MLHPNPSRLATALSNLSEQFSSWEARLSAYHQSLSAYYQTYSATYQSLLDALPTLKRRVQAVSTRKALPPLSWEPKELTFLCKLSFYLQGNQEKALATAPPGKFPPRISAETKETAPLYKILMLLQGHQPIQPITDPALPQKIATLKKQLLDQKKSSKEQTNKNLPNQPLSSSTNNFSSSPWRKPTVFFTPYSPPLPTSIQHSNRFSSLYPGDDEDNLVLDTGCTNSLVPPATKLDEETTTPQGSTSTQSHPPPFKPRPENSYRLSPA